MEQVSASATLSCLKDTFPHFNIRSSNLFSIMMGVNIIDFKGFSLHFKVKMYKVLSNSQC